jgi:hypothetical protein
LAGARSRRGPLDRRHEPFHDARRELINHRIEYGATSGDIERTRRLGSFVRIVRRVALPPS